MPSLRSPCMDKVHITTTTCPVFIWIDLPWCLHVCVPSCKNCIPSIFVWPAGGRAFGWRGSPPLSPRTPQPPTGDGRCARQWPVHHRSPSPARYILLSSRVYKGRERARTATSQKARAEQPSVWILQPPVPELLTDTVAAMSAFVGKYAGSCLVLVWLPCF